MELDEAIYRFARDTPALTALIGALPGTIRLFAGKAPQNTPTPFIVQRHGGTDRQELYCGTDGSVRMRVQVDHYGKTVAAAKACAREFRLAFKATGIVYPLYVTDGDSPPLATLKIKTASIDNEFDGIDDNPGLHVRTQIWQFWILER